MKKILLIILSLITCCYTQAQDKTLYGSFIMQGDVFKYKVVRSDNGYAIQLSTLEEADGIAGADIAKLDSTIKYYKEIAKLDSVKLKLSTDELKMLGVIPQNIEMIKTIASQKGTWIQDDKTLSSLIKLTDTLKLDTFVIGGLNKDSISNLKDLLTSYQKFLSKAADPRESKLYNLQDLTHDAFKVAFYAQMEELTGKNKAAIKALLEASSNSNEVDRIYYEIDTRLKFVDDEPVTAYAVLKKKYITAKVYETPVKFKVERLRLEFEDGTIKNVSVKLIPLLKEYEDEYGVTAIEARNNMPISIAGKFDNERMGNNHDIFVGNRLSLLKVVDQLGNKKHEVRNKKHEGGYTISHIRQSQISFRLGELLDYEIKHETDKEDYSPQNCVVDLTETTPVKELKKEKGVRLFDARAYSDIIGLNDEDPNGLVQVEISRKVNIIKARRQGIWLTPFRYFTFGTISNYTGFLTSIEPRVAFTKIEKNNRYYLVDSAQLDTAASFANKANHFALNPLDVIRYQRWNIGSDINIFKTNMHNLGLNIQFNGYFGYGRTQIADSINITTSSRGTDSIIKSANQHVNGINSTSWGFGITAELKPDSRYNISFSYNWRWVDIFSTQYSFDSKYNNTYSYTSLQGFRRLGNAEGSKVFFRFQYYWMHSQPKLNFFQLQLGYELNLFGGNSNTPKSNKS